jgi:hypothetical protein
MASRPEEEQRLGSGGRRARRWWEWRPAGEEHCITRNLRAVAGFGEDRILLLLRVRLK